MNKFNTNGLRGILDELPTAQLDLMLDEELQKEQSDPAAVKLLLGVLEERHAADPPAESSVSEKARQKYRAEMEELFPRPSGRRWTPLLRAASVVLILGMLFTVVPQKAEAETFWEMLQRMTGTVLGYFDRQDQFGKLDYVFQTENAGLQQVYDAVVELGVTEPVVPMWLPDNSELTELTPKQTPMLKSVCASFLCGEKEIIYKLDLYDGEAAHQYYKDDTYYESYEKNGTIYNITKNLNRWTVVWTKNNIECLLTLDCQEETLRRILESIYVMEE